MKPLKYILLVLLIVMHSEWSYSLSQQCVTSPPMPSNSSASYDDKTHSMIRDLNGNLIHIGSVTANGNLDVVITKFDPSCGVVWSTTWDNNGKDDTPEDVVVDQNNNIFITGKSSYQSGSDAFIVRINNLNGSEKWSTSYSNPIASFSDGHAITTFGQYVYVVGFTGSSTSNTSGLILCYDKRGNYISEDAFGGSSVCENFSVCTDPSGNVYVTGEQKFGTAQGGHPFKSRIYTLKYDPQIQALLWTTKYNQFSWGDADNGFNFPDRILEDVDGVIVGGTGLHNLTAGDLGNDFLIFKYYFDGTLAWETSFDKFNASDDLHDLILDKINGIVYATGSVATFISPAEKFVATLALNSGTGNILWDQSYNPPGIGWDYGNAIDLDCHQDPYVGGTTGPLPNGLVEYEIISYDKLGNLTGFATYNNNQQNSRLNDVVVINDAVFYSGYIQSGDYDIVKFDGPPNDCQACPIPYITAIPTDPKVEVWEVLICKGSEVKLVADYFPGFDYQWQLNGVDIPGANSITWVASTAGVYSLEITSSFCTSESNEIYVEVLPLPVINITPPNPVICNDVGNVMLTASGASTYTWSNGVNGPANLVTSTGTYTVTGTTVQGCSGSASVDVTQSDCFVECDLRANFSFVLKANCKRRFQNDCQAGPNTTITGYLWDFGDGTYSTAVTPFAHTFTQPGTYIVCLEVYGMTHGRICTDRFCMPITIESVCERDECDVTPDFSTSLTGCKVSFMDLTQTGANTNILSWSWDFGDGINSSLTNPTHTYRFGGIYQVCLHVIATNGITTCSNNYCSTVDIPGDCNTQEFDCETSAFFNTYFDGCSIYLMDASTSGPTTSITQWKWIIDGTNIYFGDLLHVPLAKGNHTICLQITGIDNHGNKCTSSFCRSISVPACDLRLAGKTELIEIPLLRPNPSSGIVNLSLNSMRSAEKKIELFNILGEVVYSEKLNVSEGLNDFPLNFTSLPKTIYWLRISDDSDSQVIKLVLD